MAGAPGAPWGRTERQAWGHRSAPEALRDRGWGSHPGGQPLQSGTPAGLLSPARGLSDSALSGHRSKTAEGRLSLTLCFAQ